MFKRGLYGTEFETRYEIDKQLDIIEKLHEPMTLFGNEKKLYFIEELPEGDTDEVMMALAVDFSSKLWYLMYTNVFKSIKFIEGLKEMYNSENLLCWVTIGRNIIEQCAVLNYYLYRLQPLHQSNGMIKKQELVQMDNALLKYMHGRKFDWSKLETGDIEGLKEKFNPEDDNFNSINVLTAISKLKKRMKSFDDIEVMYALFSEIVHPNLGSNLVFQNWKSMDGDYSLNLNADLERRQFIICMTIETIANSLSCIAASLFHLNKVIENFKTLKYLDC